LPKADGPPVKVTLHDGQQLYAVVKGLCREADMSWWYLLQIHLPRRHPALRPLGRRTRPRRLRRPCLPLRADRWPGVQPGAHRARRRHPGWKVEEPVYFGTEGGPARIVHRGDCHAVRDVSHPATTDQARAFLARDDTEPCDICRPDRPLRAAA
jgi:hypothetical protein